MEKDLFTVVDGSGKQVNVNKNDFDFVQKDSKIHDIKFKSKPTTFLKDALKRFIKSKSAFVGGCIVGGLMLLSFIVPLCTPSEGVYNISVNGGGGDPSETQLPPKLFNSGLGFWDGTVKRKEIVFNRETNLPYGYTESEISDVVTYDKYLNTADELADGGHANFFVNKDAEFGEVYTKELLNFDPNFNYTISFNLYTETEETNFAFEGYKLAICSNNKTYYLLGDENNYVKDLKVENLNVWNTFETKGYTKELLEKSSLKFIVQNNKENKVTSNMFISNFKCETNSTVKMDKFYFDSIGFNDGNELYLRKNSNPGFWTPNIQTTNGSAYKVHFVYSSFTFNPYERAYGLREGVYSAREILIEENKGYIRTHFDKTGLHATTDENVLKQRFEIVDPEGSVIYEIVEQVGNAIKKPNGKYDGYTLKIKYYNYKKLGYTKMPSFVFGTNKQSKDFAKLLFTGMRSSFFIAIGVSLVNIIIGLIWGSISGYFGGWVDIMMERFCDILSGLPSMVIITLCILYGREFNWGSASDVIALMISLFMTGWMGVSARTRTQFYRFKGREYVLASRTLGARDSRLIFRHILPNSAGTIITGSILMIPSVIYTESSIAYLGLGLQNQVLFGVILAENNTCYKGEEMYLLFIPTMFMMALLVSFNLFGNGLRDAFNPQLKGGE